MNRRARALPGLLLLDLVLILFCGYQGAELRRLRSLSAHLEREIELTALAQMARLCQGQEPGVLWVVDECGRPSPWGTPTEAIGPLRGSWKGGSFRPAKAKPLSARVFLCRERPLAIASKAGPACGSPSRFWTPPARPRSFSDGFESGDTSS